MGKYDLTPSDIQMGVNRLLAEIYSSSVISENPTIIYVVGGPGTGKTAIEIYYKKKLKNKNEKAYMLSSDKIAKFHPNYDDAMEELPEDCYKITRQFVKLALPIIYNELIKNRISIINETSLSKGEQDIERARNLKKNRI